MNQPQRSRAKLLYVSNALNCSCECEQRIVYKINLINFLIGQLFACFRRICSGRGNRLHCLWEFINAAHCVLCRLHFSSHTPRPTQRRSHCLINPSRDYTTRFRHCVIFSLCDLTTPSWQQVVTSFMPQVSA